MTYRELLELYKQGKLVKNKKHEVESDIERQEAISDYLFDRDAVDNDIFSDDKNLDDAESENDFVKMINSSIRKAFVKMGMTILVIAVAVMLFVVFALPNVVRSSIIIRAGTSEVKQTVSLLICRLIQSLEFPDITEIMLWFPMKGMEIIT